MRRLTSIEGNRQRLDGGAMFGNVPKAVWSRWSPCDERNRIPLACRALLVQEEGRVLLFETGVGAFFEPKLKDRFGVEEPAHVLLDSLAEVGLSHRDVDAVILSHLHFDHAGGLLSSFEADAQPGLLFPRARYVVGRRAWERAGAPHRRDRASFIPRIQQLLEASGRLDLVEGDGAGALGEGYRFHESDGHTPGLLLTEIAMPGGPVLFAGDLVPGTAWVHLPVTMGYDRFPELLVEEKERILADLASRRGRLFFTHDPEVALASLSQDEGGRFGTRAPHAALRALTD